MKSFNELKRLLKSDRFGMTPIKVALLGDTATQFLAQAIEATGLQYGFDINLLEADYNQVEQQFIDKNSELYLFDPQFVIIFQSTHKLLERFNKMMPQERNRLADERTQFIEQICLNPHMEGKKILCLNYPEIDDNVFGNYANKIKESFIYQNRKLNFQLMNLAETYPALSIVDIASLQSLFGRQWLFAPNIYVSTDMVISIDALPYVASRIVDVISSNKGKFHKCIILDLDNTLWGGVVGDDGIEGIQLGHGLGIGKVFSEFQMWVKKLAQRGIIVCIVSKNDEKTAKYAFEKHPDMVLKMDDIAVFMANWENKADNIRTIQSILNIGFDSMVFIDDNPFEREMVKNSIPQITVPDMPEDPAEYLEFLYSQNLFETASFSQGDQKRTEMYKNEAKRVLLAKNYTNEEEFLQSLDMKSRVDGFNKFNTPRVAQLSQRSNQFNLRTIRYGEDDIKRLAEDENTIDLCFTLQDRLGDNGLIAVVIMKKTDDQTLFIDSWIMSCRVLKRTMEQFIINTIVQKANEKGFKTIIGEYIPTPKNHMVENLYQQLGFSPITDTDSQNQRFSLSTSNYKPRKTFITPICEK